MTADAPHDRPPPSAPEQPPWPPIQALESNGPPPDRRPPLRPRQIVVAILVALGVGALLGSGALVGLAERQSLGPQRDVALGAAEVADRVAHGLSLNRPAERLADAFEDEQEVYDVEALIARARATAARTSRPQPPPAAEEPDVEGALSPVDPAPAPADPAPAPADPAPAPADPAPAPAEPALSPAEPARWSAGNRGAFDPDSGPPPDGLITPIEGVDCVPEDAAAPTAATGAAEVPVTDEVPPDGADGTPSRAEDPTGCPPGFVLADPGEPTLFDAPRTPDEDEPLQMYVGGDSISRDLGEGLARVTPADLVRIDLDPRPATGLSRPDFFDWAQHLAGVLTESRPDVIVVLFGANDFQNVEYEGEILDRFGSEWLDLYRERVDRMMTLLGQPDTQTIWVGQPPVREPRLSGGLATLNDVYAEVAAEHPHVTYIDAWDLFSDSGGGYVDEIDGVRLRREDGVHLTIDGGNRLARAVWDLVAPAWGLE